MEREYGQVTRYLEGETVYVIGGGPSLVDFDFEALGEFPMIGANDAGRLTDAQTIVTLDHNYHRHRIDDLVDLANEGRKVFSALPESHKNHPFPPEITHLRFNRGKGLSHDPGMIYGLNSGFAALNVAFLAGAKDIRLIGFDFKFKAEQPHWHEEHSWFRQKNDRQLRRWAKDFEYTKGQLDVAGVKVTNFVGPEGSEITAYETRPLTDLLE